jgi:hypothetical protein
MTLCLITLVENVSPDRLLSLGWTRFLQNRFGLRFLRQGLQMPLPRSRKEMTTHRLKVIRFLEIHVMSHSHHLIIHLDQVEGVLFSLSSPAAA